MALRNDKKCRVPSQSTKATFKVEDVDVSYSTSIYPISKDFLYSIEEDVKVIHSYYEYYESDV